MATIQERLRRLRTGETPGTAASPSGGPENETGERRAAQSGGLTVTERLAKMRQDGEEISRQREAKEQQIQQARVDLLDQALERQRMNSVQQGDFLLPGRAGQAAKRNVRVQSPEREGSADWGEIIKGWVLQGADQAATGITSTLSMLEGAAMKPMGALLGNDQLYESGPFHTLNDYMQEAKEANEEHFTPEYKKAGRIGEVLGDIGPSVVAAVPQAVLAFMTAGTSAAAQGTTAGVQAAGQAAQGAGVARTFLNTLRNTAQNPQFLYSVLSTAGNEYEQAKAEGADDGRAYAYAALTGLLNSVVEASGGIDTLTPDNKRVLRQWVDTMLDEGREEVIQGAVSRLAQNAVYGRENPLFSLEDENAVVNPSTAAQEFLGGAVVGGILGGGQLAVQQGLNAAANRQAARRAQEGVQAAQGNMGPVTQGTVQEAARGQENAASPGETATLVERVRRSIPNLEDMGPVAEVTGNEMPSGGKVVDRLVKFVNSIGNRVNRPGFGDVLFSKGRIKSSMLGHGYGNAKVETFAAVPSVIRNGVQIDHQQDWKGRGYDTYTFAAPVNYRGKRTYLGVIVTKNVQDGRYYVHEVVDENGSTIFRGNENTEPASDGRASLSGTVDTVASSVSSAPIINQAEQDVNQESVVHTAREGESRDAPETVKTGLSARGGDTGSSGASPITSVAQEGGTVNADLEERFQALLAAEGADRTQAAIGGQLLARAAAGEELNATQEALVSAMPGGGALLEAAERTARRRQEAAPAQAARQVENTETAETARRLESALGRTIRLYDGSTGQGARSRANGYYEDGTIYVNSRSQNPTAQIIAHELTHSLEGAESYGSLRRAVLEQIRRQGVDLEALREQKWNLYAREGAALAEEAQVDAEIVAEYVEKNLLTDEESILDLVRRDRSLGEQIRAFLDRVLARLGNEAARERAFLRQARGLYARALEETRQSGQREQVRQERDALREAYARGEISEEDFDAGLDAVLEQEGLLGEEMLDTVFSDGDGARYSISEDSEGQEQAEAAFQAMPVKAQTYLRGVERRLVNQVGQLLSVPRRAQREFLRDIASEISSEYLRRGTVSQETTDRLFERAYQEGVKADQAFAEEYDDLRRFLRDRRLTISPEDTADIPDFEQWRRAHFGRLNVGTRGDPNVDQIYQELSHNWSELFPAELTHPADQLQRIGEVAEDFRRVEKSLDEYYGREAETFKAWAKNDFQAVIDGVVGELRTVRRYVEEAESRSQARAAAQEQAQASTEEIAQVWRDLKSARRGYERVAAKNLLTDHDQVQVGRLLKGEIEPEHLDPRRDNVRGITAVYEAKREYERLASQLRQWNRARKSQLLAEADRLLDTANDWKDKRKGILYSRETMERNIRDIVPDKELAEEIIRTYFTPVHQGAAAANRMKNQYRDQVRELDLSRKVAKGDTVSEAHAVQLLGEAEDNIRYLEQSRGRVKARDGKTLEEWRAVVRDLWGENPGLDQEKIRDAVSRFRSIYDDLFQQMNEVRVRNGYEPVNYRQGYFPHFQPGEGDGIMAQFGKALGIKTEVTALPTTINGLTHTFRPGIRWFGNAQERLGFNTAYDAVEGFDRYIEGVADVIHQTDNIQRLRALATQARYRTGDEGIRQQVDRVLQDPTLSDTDRQNRIEKIYEDGRFALSNFVVELDEYTNLLANKKSRADRTMEQNLGRDMYNLVKALEGRVAANMVAINPASWLTNFIPITQGWGTVDSRSLLGGMWDTLRAYRKDDGFVGRSTFLTNRRGSDPLVKAYEQGAESTESGAKGVAKRTIRKVGTATGKLGETLSRPMEYIDNFTADTLVRARYNQNIRRGLSETAAMEEADAWAAGVMADRSKGATPTLFNRSSPLTKAFTQFQLEVNNQLSYLYKDLPRDVKDRGLAALAGALVKFFLGAFLYNEVYEFFIGRRPALDPIGILNDTVGDLTGTELPNLVELGVGAVSGNLPSFETEREGIGGATNTAINGIVNNLPFTSLLGAVNLDETLGLDIDAGRIPLESAIPNLGTIGRAFTDEDWSLGKRVQEVVDEMWKPGAYLALPFGGGQVKRAAEGIEAVVRGGSYSVDSDGEEILQYPVYSETLPEQVRDAAYASIFGKSSFSTARDWVESGFKSLSAKETDAYQEMTAAGVDGETAFGLIQELKGASSADKLSIAVEAGLDDEAAIAAAGLILGKDLTTEAGNPTRYAMLLNAVDTGLAATEGLDMIERGIDLEDYLELTGEGMEPETAKEVVVAMQDLEAETDRVSKLHQYSAIADLPMAEADKESALALVMSDSAYEKYQSARSAGVSTEDYVWFLSATDGLEADKDENGKSISGSRKAKVLRVIDRMDLNRSQKDALFLAAGYSESTLGDAPWR